MTRRLIVLAVAGLMFVTGASAQVYVDANLASGNNDGTAWADAYQGAAGLQAGLDDASGGDVYAAQGTYDPITLATGDVLMGGFANGDALGDRDPATKLTIIDGGDVATGVIADSVQNTMLDGITIQNCMATTDIGDPDPVIVGGGLYYNACDNTNSIIGVTFSGNFAGEGGGGGGAYFGASSPVVTDCLFDSNGTGDTGTSGGGVSNSGSATVFTNCVFINNTAQAQGAGANTGAGATFDGCTFQGNVATAGGGGIFMLGAGTVTGCTFDGNTASWIGGGLGLWFDGPWTVDNCTFTGNTGIGGGIRADGHAATDNAIPTITGCDFTGNAGVGASGTAMVLNNCDGGTVSDCVMTAGGAGDRGAIQVGGVDGTIQAINCLIYGNGGAIGGAFVTGWMDMINCTIAGNQNTTQSIVVWGENNVLDLHNTVIWGNANQLPLEDRPADYGSWSGVDHTAFTTVNYSLVERFPAGVDPDPDPFGVGTGNLAIDPIYVDAANDDYRLMFASPARDTGDAGDARVPDHDLMGDPRPGTIAGVSMGAFEESPPSPPVISPITGVNATDGDLVTRSAQAIGAEPITWSIVVPDPTPGDMAIDPDTGLFSWTADIAESPITVTIQAENSFGSDTTDFTITVAEAAPGLPVGSSAALAMLLLAVSALGVIVLRRRTA